MTLPDEAACIRAIWNGGIAALASSGLTAGIIAIGVLAESEDPRAQMLCDPLNLIDVMLVFILAVLVLMKSRVAASLLLLYYVASKTLIFIELEQIPGVLSLLLLLLYVASMRATFVWHSRYRNRTPE